MIPLIIVIAFVLLFFFVNNQFKPKKQPEKPKRFPLTQEQEKELKDKRELAFKELEATQLLYLQSNKDNKKAIRDWYNANKKDQSLSLKVHLEVGRLLKRTPKWYSEYGRVHNLSNPDEDMSYLDAHFDNPISVKSWFEDKMIQDFHLDPKVYARAKCIIEGKPWYTDEEYEKLHPGL